MGISLQFDPRTVARNLQPSFPDVMQIAVETSNSALRANRSVYAKIPWFGVRLDQDSPHFVFRANSGPIGLRPSYSLGVRAFERIWAGAFGFYALFTIIADQFNATLQQLPLPAAQTYSSLGPAVELLRWAFPSRAPSQWAPMPDHLYSPANPWSGTRPSHQQTIAIFQGMVAWMLLHETAHFALEHLSPCAVVKEFFKGHPDRHAQEYEADAWSFQETIREIGIPPLTQLCSISFGLGILTLVDHDEHENHPASLDRVRQFYTKHLAPLAPAAEGHHLQPNGTLFNSVLYAAITPLHAKLYLRGWQGSLQVFDDFDEYAAWWLATITQLH